MNEERNHYILDEHNSLALAIDTMSLEEIGFFFLLYNKRIRDIPLGPKSKLHEALRFDPRMTKRLYGILERRGLVEQRSGEVLVLAADGDALNSLR